MNAPIQGSALNDEFNRLLNAANTVVQGGHASCNTAPGAGKISAFGAAAAEALGEDTAARNRERINEWQWPLNIPRANHDLERTNGGRA